MCGTQAQLYWLAPCVVPSPRCLLLVPPGLPGHGGSRVVPNPDVGWEWRTECFLYALRVFFDWDGLALDALESLEDDYGFLDEPLGFAGTVTLTGVNTKEISPAPSPMVLEARLSMERVVLEGIVKNTPKLGQKAQMRKEK